MPGDLKKFLVYSLFLGIILVPIVGLPTTSFDAPRALGVWGVLVGILGLGLLIKNLRRSAGYKSATAPLGAAFRQAIGSLAGVPTWVYLVLLAAGAIVYPLRANNYMIDVAITCLIYVSLGLGLNIVVGLAGLLDLGYIAFFAVGAYSYACLNLYLGVNFWLAIPAGIVLGMLCGCIIGYPTLRMRGDYLAIVTMGFGEIIRIVLNNWDRLTQGPNGLLGMSKPILFYPWFTEGGLGWVRFEMKSLDSLYYLILFFATLTIIGSHRLNNSRIGRAWVAIREDEVAAELSGVPTTWLKLLAYALGAAFASVAGAFFAAKLAYTNPNFFILMESCVVLCIVVLGGSGSIPGVILAAIALIAIPEVFRELQTYRMLAFGLAMTVMMVLRPEGLIPASRRKRELHMAEQFKHED